ncbi:hypothetical protein [Empedobacter tilapiae]|uniref:DUF6630 domain-containing protein n=1 Tax=Empedobacter tilapiae TaxID=2491114 RepID=A0A4Z1BHW0_9FLAO|nr:hypothetical protein [Empedobacter tilapiae]TGN27227.1 hypothetical protein E4J94_08420 [Empedobacter tilapiae]
MEKYIEIINMVVTRYSERESLIKQLEKIKENPTLYLENNDRCIDLSHDFLWLALVDLLISYGYAFEIDWKENYDTTKYGVTELLLNWSVNFDFQDDSDLYELEAEEFFPRINTLIKGTSCQIFNFDIDSDSYVTTMTNNTNEKKLLDLDNQISKY